MANTNTPQGGAPRAPASTHQKLPPLATDDPVVVAGDGKSKRAKARHQKLATPRTPAEQAIAEARRQNPAAPLDWAAYETIAEWWVVHGNRNRSELCRRFGIGQATARKLVEEGYPDRGWLALDKRAMAAQQEAVSRAQARAVQAALGFNDFKNEHLHVFRAGMHTVAAIIKGVRAHVDTAKWTKTRRRRKYDKKGRYAGMEEYEAPLTMPELAQVLAAIARSGRNFSDAALALHRVDKTIFGAEGPEDLTSGWLDMTDEQLDHVIKHGELPPGVTPAMIYQAALNGGEGPKN